MKRTALILAGAAAFDLGVMVVAAQAQDRRSAPVEEVKISGSGLTQSTDRVAPGAASGGAVQDPTGTGGCIPGPPLPGGTANPCAPAVFTSYSVGDLNARLSMEPSGDPPPAAGRYIDKTSSTVFIKIDRVNTVQACTARQGEVTTHQGVQQCRIPAPAAPAVGNPTRRPGGIPPRN
ncbi:hypothetical protein [Brevundimonas sp.]|uniref:hypothetical protein n=1 Tax=Brevundimonas sp. TaxID=1871086 RepID=UPI002ABC209B|nr:hypothetical protein [Brevundimonas sp.]MDZ4364153.1 hypothetical protein [Brevundimonas sp.]